ncbi:MAG TPA: SCO family protein [Pyrinomonadaceae bacterium]|nr:SCO family protein [Pyrinomonadaceae bacterium]
MTVRTLAALAALLWAAHLAAPGATAQYGTAPRPVERTGTPEALKAVRVEQKLGSQLPLDATFRDESGREVRLGQYFNDKPVVLALVYYECPMLCNQVLNGLVGSLTAVPFKPGKDFEIVTVSFDARETPELAAKKKETYIRRYGRAEAVGGWHFLTGDKAQIDRVAEAAGFGYAWDEPTQQFAHGSAIMVSTPKGRLSHYFYGIEYAPKDLRLALVESSEGKVGSPVDELLLYCYHYDPATGKYGAAVMNILRAAGVLTIIGVVALILYLRRRSRDPERWEEQIGAGGAA